MNIYYTILISVFKLSMLCVLYSLGLQKFATNREVFVGKNETVILNCTCFHQHESSWRVLKYLRDTVIYTGATDEFYIPYTQGLLLNPKLKNSNIGINGNYKSGKCNLIIRNFSTYDEGTYKCEYWENGNIYTDTYIVQIRRPPKNLKIANETQNNTMEVVEGSMLQLVCSVQSGKPKEILQWITNTTVIKEGGQNGTITYRLNASSSDHMKIFICSAFNEALDNPITKQVRLDILGKPKVIVYINPDGNHLHEYQNAQLCCKTEGNPAVSNITWFKNQQRLKIWNDARHCISFTPLRRQHNGKYMCTAKNIIGFSSSTKDIRVLYPPDVSIDTTESQKKISFKCQASGDPETYEFADWDHQSVFGKHIRTIKNSRNRTIVLEEHNYQNSGIYKCSVKNGIPDISGEFYHEKLIMVSYKGPPIFVTNNTKTWFAQYKGDAHIIIKVFSSFYITRGQIRRHNENRSSESSRIFGLSTRRESMIFHNFSILVECIQLTFDLIKLENDDFGNYTVEVCNTFNCSIFEVSVVLVHDDSTSTFAYGFCWIIMGIIVGVVLLCGCSHIYCCLTRGKSCGSNILQITQEDNYMYDEVETLNYNNVTFDHVSNDENMNNDNVSSNIENNDIILRADVVSSDESSSIKLFGDGYENPYQAINIFDIDMNHYSSIVSCNYQNTTIWPHSVSANPTKYLNIAMDGVTNPWLVIYKRKY